MSASGERMMDEPKVNNDGWTDWLHYGKTFKLECCDCGLVHTIELSNGQTTFRMRREDRTTVQDK